MVEDECKRKNGWSAGTGGGASNWRKTDYRGTKPPQRGPPGGQNIIGKVQYYFLIVISSNFVGIFQLF